MCSQSATKSKDIVYDFRSSIDLSDGVELILTLGQHLTGTFFKQNVHYSTRLDKISAMVSTQIGALRPYLSKVLIENHNVTFSSLG